MRGERLQSFLFGRLDWTDFSLPTLPQKSSSHRDYINPVELACSSSGPQPFFFGSLASHHTVFGGQIPED